MEYVHSAGKTIGETVHCGSHREFRCVVCNEAIYRPSAGPQCSFVDFDGGRRRR